MLATIIIITVASVLFSAFCSLAESALFTVPLAYVRHLSDEGHRSGKILLRFKQDMGKPISAILILNTISNTVGASVVGSLVGKMYGEVVLGVFSGVFTLLILYLAEIIPKQVGATYSKKTSQLLALPLLILTKLLFIPIALTRVLDKVLKSGETGPSVSENEVLTMAKIGIEEGVLSKLTGSLIINAVELPHKSIRDVLTPRVVVQRLETNTKLEELESEIHNWQFTRIPVFDESEPDVMVGMVLHRDLMRSLLKGEKHRKISSFLREMTKVPETMKGNTLLQHFFETREHICAVIDEHGAFAGIVTLEDLVEEMLGREIVDEYDLVSDLRSYAKILHEKKIKQSELQGGKISE